MGNHLWTMGYPYHLQALMKARFIHHEPNQPAESKRIRIEVIFKGCCCTLPMIDVRMEPTLPPTNRPVKFGKRPPNKRRVLLCQLLLRKTPV